MKVTMDGRELPLDTISLGYDKFEEAMKTLIYSERNPTWRERLWRWLTGYVQWYSSTPKPEPYLMLTVVGAYGRKSAQARILKRPPRRSFWTISKGRTVNVAEIVLDLSPKGRRWLLTDERGVLILEGQFRSTLQENVIPVGWLVVQS